jgi:hypothetical protein
MKAIAEWWSDFAAHCVPVDANPLAMREMRRAFFAGFVASFSAANEIMEECSGDDNFAAAMVSALHAECDRFVREVMPGRA